MKNIDDGLRGLDEVPVPDVWTTARDRGPQPPYEPEPHLGRRLGTIALALAVVVAAFAFAFSRLSEDPQTTVGGTSRITRYRFDAPPQPIAVGEGAAWVHVGAGDEGGPPGLWRIDAASGEQQRIDVPGGEWPAVGGGSAWLLCNAPACGGHAVLQLDPTSGSVVRSIDLPGRGGQIAGVQEGVWITTDSGLSFVGKDGRVARSFPGQNYDLVGSDGASVWVSRDGGLSKIDPETGEELAEVSSFPDVCTMEVAEGTVWVASCDGGMHAGGNRDELMGIDAVSGDVLFREPIQEDGQMRYLKGVLWLADRSSSGGPIRIIGLDPRSGAPTGVSIDVPRDEARFQMMSIFGPAVFFAAGEGALWVTDFGAGEVIRVVPPAETSTPMPTSSPPSDTPLPLSTYTDPLGWTVDYPSDWIVTPFIDHTKAFGPVSGAAISNMPMSQDASGYPGVRSDGSFTGGVAVVISHVEGSAYATPERDDSTFPLEPSRAQGIPGGETLSSTLSFRANGVDYTATFGNQDGSPSDLRALDEVIRSLRVPALAEGQRAGEWLSVGPAENYPDGRGSPNWAGPLGVIYVMRGPQGTYALDLEPDGCGEGENESWDGRRLQVLLICPDGTEVRYERDGSPVAGNPVGFTQPLEVRPVITAWNGSLLVNVHATESGIAEHAWP